MSLKPIIDDIANQADGFLDGVTTRSEARAAISEQLTIKYRTLSGIERSKVIDGVLAILDDEDFFELGAGSEADDADASDEA